MALLAVMLYCAVANSHTEAFSHCAVKLTVEAALKTRPFSINGLVAVLPMENSVLSVFQIKAEGVPLKLNLILIKVPDDEFKGTKSK